MTPCPAEGREYPPEKVWEAQELYCVARLSYCDTAQHVGVAASTLKRWGKQFGWAEKRERLAQAQADIRADTVLARSEMLKELIAGRNPVVGFAVAKLEELALKQAEAERQRKQTEAAPQPQMREIHTQADAAAALKEAVEIKLARLLASPEDVDLKAVKDVKEALAMIETMQAGSSKPKKSGGLSAAQADEIRRKILGGE